MKPKFYLEILNGASIAFGINVFLDSDRQHILFSQFNNPQYDNRIDLFKQFVVNENLGLLDFTFEIFHKQCYINMKWMGEKFGSLNVGRQDCRKWIWGYNGMRNRVARKENGTGGNVVFK